MRELEDAFWERGYEVLHYAFEELRAGAFDPWLQQDTPAVVVGQITAVRTALERAGCAQPQLPCFPEALAAWVGREVRRSTLGEVRRGLEETPARFPQHVKPADRDDLFSGVLVSAFRDLIPLAAIPGEAAVLVQEPVRFVSEWRAYVQEGELLRLCNYKGDPLCFPDAETVRAGLAAFTPAPAAFGADWGVTEDGRTLLVEVNDAFALGNYGLHGHELAGFVATRWRELVADRAEGELAP